MKKSYVSVLLVLMAVLFAGQTFSQTLSFEVENASGYQLYGIFISPRTVTDWSEDLLVEDEFLNGVTAVVTIPEDYYPEECEFTFKVSYKVGGQTYEEVLCWVDACEKAAVKIIKNTEGGKGYMRCQYK